MIFCTLYHNFCFFQKFITPRIKIKQLQDSLSTKLGCQRVPPIYQKFLNHHLSDFLALHLSKLDFESEKLQNCRFRGAIFFVMGVRLVRNFFLSDFGLIRGKKFFTNPKLCGTSLALYESIFTIQNRKLSIFLIFQRKFLIFSTFLQNLWRVPRCQKFLSATNRAKQTYDGGAPKYRQHLTPKSSIPNSFLETNF